MKTISVTWHIFHTLQAFIEKFIVHKGRHMKSEEED